MVSLLEVVMSVATGESKKGGSFKMVEMYCYRQQDYTLLCF